ncbi:hypothetical protein BH10PSE19_BH10PSE19_18900 [soil metagenome]
MKTLFKGIILTSTLFSSIAFAEGYYHDVSFSISNTGTHNITFYLGRHDCQDSDFARDHQHITLMSGQHETIKMAAKANTDGCKGTDVQSYLYYKYTYGNKEYEAGVQGSWKKWEDYEVRGYSYRGTQATAETPPGITVTVIEG